LANQLYQNVLQGGGQQPAQPNYAGGQQYAVPQQTVPQQVAPPVAGPQLPTEDEWLNTPAVAAQKQADYYNQTQVAPQFQQTAAQMASMARALAQQQDPEAFQKFGPEIDIQLRSLNPEYWTVDNIKKVVGIVKSEHMQDLVAEGVEREIQRRQEAGTIVRPGTVTGGTTVTSGTGLDLDNAEISSGYKDRLRRYNWKKPQKETS
jgi:hypothetical protein